MTSANPRPIARLGPVDVTFPLPGSKSITNRALVCAALADGPSTLVGALDAEDTRAMRDVLAALDIRVAATDTTWTIDPTERAPIGRGGAPAVVDVRQSGTTARFALPLLATLDRAVDVDADPQMRARPMGPTLDALRALGATVEEFDRPGHLPVRVAGPLRGGEVALGGGVSSQFLSGLLLVGPTTDGLRVHVDGPLVSRRYVDMTVAVMAAFGAHVEVTEAPDRTTWTVAPGGYRGAHHRVEPDASAATYAWGLAVATRGRVTVEGLSRAALQGDVGFVDVLEAMGATVTDHATAITVAADRAPTGVDVDLEPISDTVPTLAALAALATGPTRVRGVGFVRHKESDRIAGPVAELVRLGIDAIEEDDGMWIAGATDAAPRGAVVHSYDDHRMAMAFSLVGVAVDGVAIADPDCVAKTFPGYWDVLAQVAAGTLPRARAV